MYTRKIDNVDVGQPRVSAPTQLARLTRSRPQFSPLLSSEDNNSCTDRNFYGPYADIRATLDYSYHKNYTKERQLLQTKILQRYLDDAVLTDQNGEVCTTPTMPWIVFTAGAFGAGKGYTLNQLVLNGRFPLVAFVRVNPDDIRRELPEFPLYVQENPEYAGDLTNKEAGYIAEVLTLAGLRMGKNVIVDGSLRCSSWYRDYFARLRLDFPSLRIAILHVTAPPEAVFQRAAERAVHTKRIVPRELLEEALEQVPRSVRELAPLVDYHVELSNPTGAADIELVTPGETWISFTSQWIQTCKWVPKCQSHLIEKSRQIEQNLISAADN